MEELDGGKLEEVVADKGYHSNDGLVKLSERGVRSYIAEPDRGRRRWDGKEAEQQQVSRHDQSCFYHGLLGVRRVTGRA